MSLNPNIFDQLNSYSESEDFFELIDKSTQPPQFAQLSSTSSDESKNIFESLNEQQKQDKDFGFLETVKDVGEQIVEKGTTGFLGNYGNVLEAIGLQSKEKFAPGQEEKFQRSFDDPYEEDILEGIPQRLPTSKDIQQILGTSEGQTPAGRIAGRGAEFVGEGVSLGGGGAKALLSLAGSGVAGQSVREAGGPEALATGIEIAGPIGQSLVEGRVRPRAQEGKKLSQAGRDIGLSEKDITPLVQSEGKVSLLSKIARKGEKTKQQFSDLKKKLGDSYESIKGRPDTKIKLSNADQISLRREFADIRNELSKTLAPSPEKEAALKYIEKSLDTLRNVDITPEYLVNFWQDINKAVKWNSINGGKKALTELKEPISKILKKVVPEAAEQFEKTNLLYTKYSQISKKLKPDVIDAFINKGEIMAAAPAGLAFVTGNPWPLAALGSESAMRTLATEMLTNPYFQNLGNKLVVNFNQASAKGVTDLVKNARQFMERRHPEEDWSFLTD